MYMFDIKIVYIDVLMIDIDGLRFEENFIIVLNEFEEFFDLFINGDIMSE